MGREKPPSDTVGSSAVVDFHRYHELEEQMFEAMMGGKKSPLFLSAEQALERYLECKKAGE